MKGVDYWWVGVSQLWASANKQSSTDQVEHSYFVPCINFIVAIPILTSLVYNLSLLLVLVHQVLIKFLLHIKLNFSTLFCLQHFVCGTIYSMIF